MASAKATETIPYLYRFLLTNVESLFAFGGVIMCMTNPGVYLSSLTRESTTTIQPTTDFIYTQLAGGWLFISFAELVILRLVDDVKVWKLICAGILLSDALYTHSVAQAVGGWGEWLKFWEWTGQDWGVTITTWPFVLVRVAIVFGIGLKTSGVKKRQ